MRGRGSVTSQGQKPRSFKASFLRLMGYLMKRKWMLFSIIAISLSSSMFQIVIPRILGQTTTIISQAVMNATGSNGFVLADVNINYDAIMQVLMRVVILYLCSISLRFIQGVLLTRFSERTVQGLRQEMKTKMSKLSVAYYDQHSYGDIMSRAINDVDSIAQTLQQTIATFMMSTVQFFGAIIMMLVISPVMTLIALVTIPMSLMIASFITPRSQRLFSKQQKELGQMNDQIEEKFSGQIEVKSFSQEEDAIQEFEKANDNYYEAAWRAQFLSGIIMPTMNLVKNLGYVLVAILGGLRVASGQMVLGDVQAFIQYSNQLNEPLKQMANMANLFQATIASAERVFEFLDEPEMSFEQLAIQEADTDNKVSIEHVQFGYEPDSLLMTDFNLEVQPGQMVAIVGPTGAGKSTIINLLERFYDVDGGHIRIDGEDVRTMTREALRDRLGMVLQDTWLFKGSIYENIAYGSNTNPTYEQVIAAAEAAHVSDFAEKLPGGYDFELNEDASNISQGQRQLITIARAFVSDPEILILDEATSSVDTRTEVLIQKAMQTLLQNRTSFVVAHRLSTIRDADQIIVMNKGSVIETGNHDSLIALDGFYASLYNSQFQEEAE